MTELIGCIMLMAPITLFVTFYLASKGYRNAKYTVLLLLSSTVLAFYYTFAMQLISHK